jgi:hypothetical protein
MNKLWIPAAVIAVLLLSSTAHAQQTIGSTTSVTPSATGNYGGNQRTLQTGTSVYHQENIQTGDTGRTAMRFRAYVERLTRRHAQQLGSRNAV